jgi:hypothetical protein
LALSASEGIDSSIILKKGKASINHECTEKTMNDKYFSDANNDFLAGELEMEKSNYVDAIKYLRNGIKNLGNIYLSKKFIDDTGMRIVLADNEGFNKRLKVCASILRNVLASRLSMYQEKCKAEGTQ